MTGSSILGIKFDGGVMMASDTLASYGSLARFRSVERLVRVGEFTIIGGSGEFSDFQKVTELLERQVDKDHNQDDGAKLYPRDLHNYLIRVMYNRRNKFDPFYNSIVVGGFREEKAFLGFVDLVGSHFEDDTIATGFGAHLALPLLRKHWELKKGRISMDEARNILEESMRVLFYRDARTINKMQLAVVTKNGVTISEPYALKTVWQV